MRLISERNIKLTIAYDGTAYHGWQRQTNAISVQEVLEEALSRICKEPITIYGAGRTDSGVHASGQVANFKTTARIPVDRIPYAINSVTPRDLVVYRAEEADQSFHTRYSAKGKVYVYRIYNAEFPSPFWRNFALHYPLHLDVSAMRKASEYLIGTHDFSSFRAAGSEVKTSVRTVKRLEITHKEELITIIAEADGFLYNMVRIIVGALLDVGSGKLQPDDVQKILLAKDRGIASPTAPSHGLTLLKVHYYEVD